jgi:hypothetical protein
VVKRTLATPSAAEHPGEDVLEAAGATGAAGGEAGAAVRHLADLVVLLALLGVGEHGWASPMSLNRSSAGSVPGVLVRVVLPGELAVGLLDRASSASLGTPRIA